MKLIYLLSLLILTCSCKNRCDGPHQWKYDYGATITCEDSVEKYGGHYRTNLTIKELSRMEDGALNGRCMTKKYKSEVAENIDSNALIVYCDQDLYYNGDTIARGENLLNHRSFMSGSLRSGYMSLRTTSASAALCKYYLKGTTIAG